MLKTREKTTRQYSYQHPNLSKILEKRQASRGQTQYMERLNRIEVESGKEEKDIIMSDRGSIAKKGGAWEGGRGKQGWEII